MVVGANEILPLVATATRGTSDGILMVMSFKKESEYAGLLGHEVDAGLAENMETFRENGMNADRIAADRTNLLADVFFLLQFAYYRGGVRIRCVFLAECRLVNLCNHVLREREFQILFVLSL